MTSPIVVVVVVVAVLLGLGLGLLGYLRGGPDGGRDRYRTNQEGDRERLRRRLEDNDTLGRAEEEFQRRRRPTHEDP